MVQNPGEPFPSASHHVIILTFPHRFGLCIPESILFFPIREAIRSRTLSSRTRHGELVFQYSNGLSATTPVWRTETAYQDLTRNFS